MVVSTEPLLLASPNGLWKLYVSHFLSCFGDRLWQFATPVLFMTIWNDTLLPGAVFNFIVNLLTAFVFPNIGAYVDHTPRKKAMLISVFGEAASMLFAAGGFWVLLDFLPDESDSAVWTSPPMTLQVGICYAVIALFSTMSEVFMQVGTLSLELSWPSKLAPKAQDPDGKVKAQINSTMSSIDQLCKLLGPAAYGIVVQLASGKSTVDRVFFSVLVVLAWNLVCVPLEWFTLASLYASCPALAEQDAPKKKKAKSFFTDLAAGWKIFVGHPLLFPSISGVLVSFTVLNQSPVSTAWMVWTGIPIGVLGSVRGLSAVSGIVGSWSYRWVYDLSGTPERTGQIGICTFAFLLIPCAVSMAMFGSTIEGAWVLLGAITMSRFALFWFKPAMNQLTQERIGDDVRGAFAGTKKSLNNLFTVGIAAVAIAFPNPSEFPILVYMSVAAVTSAAVFFCVWMARDKQSVASTSGTQ